MPLVLTAGAPTASGHAYDDVPGVRHEYPKIYRKLIVPGTPFIYYRGSRSRKIGMKGPAYFGSGVVGEIELLANTRYRAEILDYVEFDEAVNFRDSNGEFLEPRATGATFFQRGVRPIDEVAFARILKMADADSRLDAVKPPVGQPRYARFAAEARLVEEYAIQSVIESLIERFGNSAVDEMPRNNPGFDILVRRSNAPDLHVEVKGTRFSSPVFFLTEGERVHSIEYSDAYQLTVVYGIDLEKRSHLTVTYEGEIGGTPFRLAPMLWQVRPGLIDGDST